MRKEIGGYFELEIKKGAPYHKEALPLNSGRNCLAYLLQSLKIRTLYYPHYNCEVLINTVRELCPNIKLIHYHIDKNFKPILSGPVIEDERLLYINYYGLCEAVLEGLPRQTTIVDNSQSFYLMPNKQDTFYSPRKFFGVPDGGYLYTSTKINNDLKIDVSFERMAHLLKRIDLTANEGYLNFRDSEESINSEPIKKMSVLTRRLLGSIDYDKVSERRIANFLYLHTILNSKNELSPIVDNALNSNSFVPFVYPFMTNSSERLREKLIANKIYIAKYWPPELMNSHTLSEVENKFTNDILPLPIDQRYDTNDMNTIIQVLDDEN